MQRALLFATLAWVGCATAVHPKPAPPVPSGPVGQIGSDEEYQTARADFDALPVDAPSRRPRRAALLAFDLGTIDKALDGGHLEEAFEALRRGLTLYDAAELTARLDEGALARAAERLERAFSRRGGHKEVILALTVEEALADQARRASIQDRYHQVAGWLTSGASSISDEAVAIDGRESLIEDLEAAAQVWPTPFVVSELSTLYADRKNGGSESSLFNRKLRRGAELQELLKGSTRSGLAYELARLYLRISKPEEALAQLKKLSGQPGDDPQVRGLVEQALDKNATPDDQVKLALLFVQNGGHDDKDVALRVCRDAARRFPQSAEPRLCAGRLAAGLDQLGLALASFEEAVRLQPTNHEAWELLGRLYQLRLVQVVSDENLDVKAMESRLGKVEAFYAEAQRRFPDKQLHPSMADALFQVGRGYYNAGRLADAQRYLERTLALVPTPDALELLGQIRLKKGDGKQAVDLFEKASAIPIPDDGVKLWWRAKLRRQLADAQEAAGDNEAAIGTRKAALLDWEKLISLGLTPEASAEAGLDRAKLSYQLGDRDTALDSFRKAIDAAPDRGSTYADAIAWLVARGELEEALDAYHRALGRNEVTDYLKVYCSLWVIDLARRAGEPEDPLAAAYLKSTDGAKWFDDLARWATGREAEPTLVERANTPGRRAEIAFYRAMRAWGDGKKDEARALWKQVLDTDMLAFFEYDMATFYLKQGAPPSKPVLSSRPRESSGPKPPPGSI